MFQTVGVWLGNVFGAVAVAQVVGGRAGAAVGAVRVARAVVRTLFQILSVALVFARRS